MNSNDLKEKIDYLLTLFEKQDYITLLKSANKYIKANLHDPVIYNIMGMSFYNLKKFDKSIVCIKRAIKLKSDFSGAYNNLAYIYMITNHLGFAIENFKKALHFKPKFLEPMVNLGICYTKKRNWDLALKYFKKALEISPNSKEILFNIGAIYIDKEEYDKALTIFDKIIKKDPNDYKAFNNLGNIYKLQSHFDKAIYFYKKSLKINSKFYDSLWNFSYCSLYNFDFKNGWKYYDYRWDINGFKDPCKKFNKRKWDGKSKGTILICSEQGIGDQILFSRVLSFFDRKIHKVYFMLDDKMYKIMSLSFPNINFITKEFDIKFDYVISLGDLPKYLIKDTNDLKKYKTPYIKTPLINQLKERKLSFKNRFVCGLSWISNNKHLGKNKSLSLEKLKNLLTIPNLSFIDLQYTDTTVERNNFYDEHGVKILKFENIDNFNDIFSLSSLVQFCDIVVTISNSTAHLAGAINKKTYLLIPKGKGRYWYWSKYKNNCIWYPSIRIIEQSTPGNWNKPIDDLRTKVLSEIIK